MKNNDNFWLDLAAIKYLEDNTNSDKEPNLPKSPIFYIIFGIALIAISLYILHL